MFLSRPIYSLFVVVNKSKTTSQTRRGLSDETEVLASFRKPDDVPIASLEHWLLRPAGLLGRVVQIRKGLSLTEVGLLRDLAGQIGYLSNVCFESFV